MKDDKMSSSFLNYREYTGQFLAAGQLLEKEE
jgi:hypothetical protein